MHLKAYSNAVYSFNLSIFALLVFYIISLNFIGWQNLFFLRTNTYHLIKGLPKKHIAIITLTIF
jgi:hypothetical protein